MLRNRAAKILNQGELKEFILDTVHKIEKQYSRLTDQEYLSLYDTLSRIHFRGKEQAMPEGYAYVGKQFEAFEGDDKNRKYYDITDYINFKPDDFPSATGLKVSDTGVVLSGPAREDSDDCVEDQYKYWPTEMSVETIKELVGLYPGLSPDELPSKNIIQDNIQNVCNYFLYLKRSLDTEIPAEEAAKIAKHMLPPDVYKYIKENPNSRKIIQQLKPLLHCQIGNTATELLEQEFEWMNEVFENFTEIC